MKVAFILALLIVVHGSFAVEGQAIQSLSPRTTVDATVPAAVPRAPTKPFASLFASQVQQTAKPLVSVTLPIVAQIVAPPAAMRPRVVCGMTIVPVDPGFDAAIRHVAPETGMRFTIRIVPPRVCGQ